MRKLIFVYNADSGKLNALGHTLHKILSPSTYQCRLCSLSHTWLAEKKEWRSFVDSLGIECEFLHKDEHQEKYEDVTVTAYPVVLMDDIELVSAVEFSNIFEIEDLQKLIEYKLTLT